MDAFIKAISYYLPQSAVTNEDINNRFPEWSVDKIASKIGIKERHIAAPDEFASDLAINAAEKLFSDHSIDKNSIDFILYCTQSPDYFLPTTACLLQDKLSLPKTVGALDFNLGCSGFVYGLSLAKGLIVSKAAKNVLLITSETYSKFIHVKDKSNQTIFGDAAAATLVSNDGSGFKIGEFAFGTDGSGAENLIVRNGGIKNFNKNGEDISGEEGFIRNDSNLYMNGNAIFQFTVSSIPGLVKETLAKNQLEQNDIDLFVFHQANKYMLDFIRKKIGIPEEKFFYFLENCGNTVSSTIPIALKEAIEKGVLVKGKRSLLAGFGVGYSWAGCTLS